MDEIKLYRFADLHGGGQSLEVDRMEAIWDRNDGATDKPHRHNFYTVLWVKQGKGTHLVDFTSYPMAMDQVYFVRPGQVHQVAAQERPMGWVITFSSDFLAQNYIREDFLTSINLFRQYEDNPPLLLDPTTAQKLQAYADAMEAVQKHPDPFSQEALGAWLKLFLIACNQICEYPELPGELPGISHALLRDFKIAVDQDFRQQHKVSPYAEDLFVSPKYLSQVIKSLTGKTAKEFIQDRIILEAKRLLLHSSASIKEIAYELGFEEPLHFSGFFKNCVGISPSGFRLGQV